MKKEIIKQTDKYYTEKIEKYGTTNLGVDWNSVESQELRFEQTSKVITEQNDKISVCDYGCGYGAYFDYLQKEGYDIEYTGIDVSKKMIECASESHLGNTNAYFINGDTIDKKYDYIIASGIFNVRQGVNNDEWKQYVYEIINLFNKYSIKGFSFNCLTKYSDKEYMKDYLYYADPLEMFDYLKKNCAFNVALLHDYNLYEFTILVKKQ